ncbi:hypothetical protein SAMN06295974_3831 [Plantibacter flavus]|uniref:Uncharacterized protein n=1 Tax=Plantibacter flavus TaxID=150123 RepID=A0A3N2BL63_9MICO|nr:hypothetical protein [Plantibacter flavus]ROR76023.1 hypothetical protein EDD42_3975 [Plantibacter flavus]SMG49235.1 hypothetical protein SAMN06295974_3831 [Plantibacter flavus]
MGIPAERLREGQQVLVRGNISFSRLASLVEGEALARSIEQAKSRGSLYPTKVPHTTINIVNARVVPGDPTNPTLEEQFVNEKIFPVKKGENAGKPGFGLDSKSTYLPTILEPDPEHEGQYRQVVLERDLASGLDVTIVINIFKNGDFEKRGLGLQQVVLHEELRYFASGVSAAQLAARGIVVHGDVKPVTGVAAGPVAGAAAPQAAVAAAPVEYPANTVADPRGYAAPMPGAQGTFPAPAAQSFPVSAPLVQTAPAAQAFPQAAPAAALAAQQFPVSAPVQAPAPAAATVAAPVESPEETIARLQQQLAEQAAAQNGSGGASAFDAAAPAAAPTAVGGSSPWDVAGLVGAGSYQG